MITLLILFVIFSVVGGLFVLLLEGGESPKSKLTWRQQINLDHAYRMGRVTHEEYIRRHW